MLKALVKNRAIEIGFDLVGIAPVDAYDDLKFSREWVERGFGGEMRYLENPKRDDPRRILPSAQSVICVGLIYNADLPYSTDVGRVGSRESRVGSRAESVATTDKGPRTKDHGWISRYAWGSDYHKIMRVKLEELRQAVEAMAPETETRVFVDSGPVVERAFARLSGIGWTGKNTCLINESKGSWFFLGVMLTSLALAPDLPAPDRCGTCTACIEACPTQALVEPYVMDASRCIAYLNIELKGTIPEEFRPAMGAHVVGCDICQDVCPWNNRPLFPQGGISRQLKSGEKSSVIDRQRKTAATTDLAAFQPIRVDLRPTSGDGAGCHSHPATDNGPQTTDTVHQTFSLFNPPLESLAALSEEDFRRVFQKSPIKRVKYRGWLRNICVAMGNSGDSKFLPQLRRLHEQKDPIVREHAGWAIQQITRANPLAAESHPPHIACSS